MKPQSSFLAWSALLTLSFCPPIFERLFAIIPLSSIENTALWIVFALATAILLSAFLNRHRLKWSRPIIVIFGLLTLELGARVFVTRLLPSLRPQVTRHTLRAYPEMWRYQGHPFLQLTGNPNFLFEPNWTHDRGFPGKPWKVEKSAGSIRVATIGGSTTTSGYPQKMEQWFAHNSDRQLEAINLGGDGHTSAHHLATLSLIALDLSPDYVIWHSAANDAYPRTFEKNFRSDYSHAFRAFTPPPLADYWPYRFSLVYRELRQRWFGETPRAVLNQTTRYASPAVHSETFSDPKTLAPYRRNLTTFVDILLARKIRPVLTTQPRGTQPNLGGLSYAPHIDQANHIARSVAQSYGKKVLFVDLDRQMTGKHEALFLDVTHLNPAGIQLKAKILAAALAKDLQENAKNLTPPLS